MIRQLGLNYRNIPRSKARNKELNLESLAERRLKNDLFMVWKILRNKVDLDRERFFTLAASRTKGDSSKLVLKKPRYSLRYNFFINRAGSDYIKLSKKFKIVASARSSKNIVGKYLKGCMFSSNRITRD